MTDHGKDRPVLGTGLPARDDYEVGYGKPPKATSFKPGQSGNPKGRPKGSRNRRPALREERMKDIILTEAYRTITVRDGEKPVTIPIAQAVVRSLAVNAAKGQHRAQRLFSELLAATEAANRRLHDSYLETAIAYKVAWERELDRRAILGLSGPEPLPHPDHVQIDLVTGTVRIAGPATRDEKAGHDRYKALQAELRASLRDLEKTLAKTPDTAHRDQIEEDIAQTKNILETLDNTLPD